MTDDSFYAKTIGDLMIDSSVFYGILKDCTKKLKHVHRMENNVAPIYKNVHDLLHQLELRTDDWVAEIKKAQSSVDISSLYEKKNELVRAIHECIGIVGQAWVSSHWQSPSIDQSVVDASGNIRGKIIAHFNDYTRDQHVLGVEFEKMYRKEYVRVPRTIPVYTYATVSGMAAMTTAALMILGETPRHAPILLGASCYFETKQLIKKMFGARVHEENLTNHEAVSRYIREYAPAAVFADTIGNEPGMHIVEGPSLIRQMSVSNAQKKYVVLDLSASAFMRAPMSGISLPKGLMLIGVESQNKLLQFGFDRVTAGVVWGTGFDAMLLYDYRDHAGTICPDASVATLPTPSARLASIHTHRIERNTKMLVAFLRRDPRLNAKLAQVVYPSLRGFCGVYCMLYWQERPLRTFDGYIHRVMKHAKHKKIPLVHGTSFGFHTTRLYTVAKNTHYERPFLRISPGTETEEQILQIAQLLADAL